MNSVLNAVAAVRSLDGAKQRPIKEALDIPLTNRSRDFELASTAHNSENENIRAAAKDFEAAFITQMLTFSGLGKALTTGGGEEVSAFTGFYIESLAEQMTEAGGFGLADRFYADLVAKNSLENKEETDDDYGKL